MKKTKYGTVKLNIEPLLKEKGISKNKICSDMALSRPNFNRYCQNKFQRIDALMIAKLCYYLDCELDDLITYFPPDNQK